MYLSEVVNSIINATDVKRVEEANMINIAVMMT